MSIRVFISHSTQPRAGEAESEALSAQRSFIDRFVAFIKSSVSGVDCFIDREINLGADWQNVLFSEIHACHAAVVFVNRQALEDSDWVDYEVTTLMNRWRCEKERFFLILVPFDDVTASNIAEHPSWKPAEPGQVQCLPSDRLNVSDEVAIQQFLNNVVDRLREVPEDDEFTTDIVDRVRCCLSEGNGVLKRIAQMVGLPSSYESHDFTQYSIIRKLYFKGPTAYPKLMGFPGFPDKCRCLGFIDLLATYWIDVKSSSPIYSANSIKGGIFVINGKEVGFTPNLYVRHVCKADPVWEVIIVDIQLASIVSQIYSKLSKLPKYRCLLINEAAKKEDNAARLKSEEEKNGSVPQMNQKLIDKINEEMSGKYASPVFVTFRYDCGGSVDDVIAEIHDKFKYVSIIIFTGEEPVSSLSSSNLKFFKLKELSLKRESAEFENYKEVKKCLP